jgi:hypothetical protein
MKISFKTMVGLAAIGGAVAYARKHGGAKQAFNHLMAKKDELVKKAQAKKSEMNARSTSEDVGYSGSSGYTSGGFERH